MLWDGKLKMFPWNNNLIWAITDVGKFDFVFYKLHLKFLKVSCKVVIYLAGLKHMLFETLRKKKYVGKVKCTWLFKRFKFLLFSQQKKKKNTK